MKPKLFSLLILLPFLASGQPGKTLYKTFGSVKVYEVESKGVYIFRAGFAFDADGAAKAYHKNDNVALDFLANAGKPGNWWGIVTNTGKKDGIPVVQSASDPAPGYYVSSTSLVDKSKKMKDPLRYVDSGEIPYVAIPSKFSTGFKLGDLALVVNKKNGLRCYAIFADVGPGGKIGEGSINLAKQLHIPGSPKKGGPVADVVYILIKKSGNGAFLNSQQIQQNGKAMLSEADITSLLSD
ncbi:glycoside hydrolase family 75 protein [Dyadobacter sp. CY327]|uniref:glycoside hydrolase family 75 protein n=1 Tax=Dyadobacter sp. CY327 TaxID=2907301 RepID=UPI001F2C5B55|nr:glycoside hydrolase family 75 protein [Dyadobacter sp. CY327]MCE7070885.1 glycoside hydrolase family 75 protein [Dyadobacter sp. CY327]